MFYWSIQFGWCLSKVVENLQALEPLFFPLCGISLNDTHIIVYKREKVLLISKANRRYWTDKIDVNIPIGFCCPLLGCSIISLCGFCFFTAVADIFFIIITKGNIVISKRLFQSGKIEVSETLIPAGKKHLFVLRLVYVLLFAFVNIIVFEEANSCY